MLARLHSKGARNIPFYYDVDIALPTDAICTAAFAQAFELAAISYSALRTAAMPILPRNMDYLLPLWEPRKRSELPAPMLPLNTHILLLPAVLVEGKPWPMPPDGGDYGGSLLMLSQVRARPTPLTDYRVYHSWTEVANGPGVSLWRFLGTTADLYDKKIADATTDMLETAFGVAFTSIYVIGSSSDNYDLYIRTTPLLGQTHYGKYRHYIVKSADWTYAGLIDGPIPAMRARL